MSLDAIHTNKNAIPVVKGFPFLGSTLDILRNPLSFWVDTQTRYGNVFKVNTPTQKAIVLAGIDANKFLAKYDGDLLSSSVLFGGYSQEIGSDQLMVALDGEPHRNARKQQRYGYSLDAIAHQLPLMRDVAIETLSSFRRGDVVNIREELRYLVTRQLAMSMANHKLSRTEFRSISSFIITALNIHTFKKYPRFFAKFPQFKQAKKESFAIAQAVVDWHRQTPPNERKRTLVDDLLDSKDISGDPVSDDFIRASTLAIFVAGMDTVASTCSLGIYAILKNNLSDELREESEDMFLKDIQVENFHHLKKVHDTVLETMRIYPVAPVSLRESVKEFEFGGYSIPKNTKIIVANTTTHFTEFKNANEFDITRWSSRPEPYTFTPYTVGAHTCLGARVAEVLTMLNLIVLVNLYRYELTPTDYSLKTILDPTITTEKKFRVKIVN